MKRLLGMLLLAVLLLAGCGGKNTETPQTAEPVKQQEQTVPQEKKEQAEAAGETDKKEADEDAASPTVKSSVSFDKDNGYPYYIKVNYQANTVTVYSKDSRGEYSVPCRVMLCSTGTYTPKSGVYRLCDQGRWRWLDLQGDVYGQYCTQITGNILFHSVPYTKESKDSLEYWEFDKLGTSCSAGCVRMQVRDAIWVYENKSNIYAVEFYASSDPGPMGKPSAPKISDNIACRNWDPTDPDSNNPWHRNKVAVGSYVGKSEADAIAAAKSLGLSVGSSVYQYSSKAKGTVLTQSLSSGTSVDKGTGISFTVSEGPEPVSVGLYTELSLEQAQAAAQALGLQVEVIYTEGEPAGIVVAQSISEGSLVPPGSTILLTVMQSEIPDPVNPTELIEE